MTLAYTVDFSAIRRNGLFPEAATTIFGVPDRLSL